MTLSINQPVPAFKVKNDQDQIISSTSLIGQIYVLYFYPKDDTPGCTAQACQFRDAKILFDEVETKILGVSPDSENSHEKFSQKYQLNFTLLSDPSLEICHLFGVWQEKKIFGKTTMGVVRSTFIVDTQGIIQWMETPVRVEGHAERVLQAIHTIKNRES